MTRTLSRAEFDQESEERLQQIIASHHHREGPLLPILHDVQAEWGMIPDAAHPLIARALGLTRAEVHGVVSFYHDFRDAPAGQHVLRLCRAEACISMGGDELAEQITRALGIGWNETTPDGRLTLEPVFCLGLCACAPTAQLDDQLIGRANTEKLTTMVQEVRA